MKKRLRQFLKQRNLDEIANLAVRKRRVLSTLVSLTFDPEPLISWRAVEAMGAAAEYIAQNDPDGVIDHLRRLYWLVSEESGGICWRSPEAMAEIVHRRPVEFSEYVPIVVGLMHEMAEEDLNHFRPGILWAIGRLGSIAEKELPAVLPAIQACLDHEAPQVRGMAAWCLGQCGQGELLAGRDDLVADEAPVAHYEDGQLVETSVGELVRRSAQK